MIDYQAYFQSELGQLRQEGNYRVFVDLKRQKGAFPKADWRDKGQEKPVTIWCSNDYLGMGQHPYVIAAIHAALEESGAGAGGTRNISGSSHAHVDLEQELAALH